MWAQGMSTGGGFWSSSHRSGVRVSCKWDGLGLKNKKKKDLSVSQGSRGHSRLAKILCYRASPVFVALQLLQDRVH